MKRNRTLPVLLCSALLMGACTMTVTTDFEREDQEDDTAPSSAGVVQGDEALSDQGMQETDQPDEQEDVDADPGEGNAMEAPADDGTVEGSTAEDTGGTGNPDAGVNVDAAVEAGSAVSSSSAPSS